MSLVHFYQLFLLSACFQIFYTDPYFIANSSFLWRMAVSFFIMFIARLKYYFAWIIGKIRNVLAPVVQRLDNAIHRINHYLADKY